MNLCNNPGALWGCFYAFCEEAVSSNQTEACNMTFNLMNRTTRLYPTGKSVAEQRESKQKAEEVLIEEILKAAGLEALD